MESIETQMLTPHVLGAKEVMRDAFAAVTRLRSHDAQSMNAEHVAKGQISSRQPMENLRVTKQGCLWSTSSTATSRTTRRDLQHGQPFPKCLIVLLDAPPLHLLSSIRRSWRCTHRADKRSSTDSIFGRRNGILAHFQRLLEAPQAFFQRCVLQRESEPENTTIAAVVVVAGCDGDAKVEELRGKSGLSSVFFRRSRCFRLNSPLPTKPSRSPRCLARCHPACSVRSLPNQSRRSAQHY